MALAWSSFWKRFDDTTGTTSPQQIEPVSDEMLRRQIPVVPKTLLPLDVIEQSLNHLGEKQSHRLCCASKDWTAIAPAFHAIVRAAELHSGPQITKASTLEIDATRCSDYILVGGLPSLAERLGRSAHWGIVDLDEGRFRVGSLSWRLKASRASSVDASAAEQDTTIGGIEEDRHPEASSGRGGIVRAPPPQSPKPRPSIGRLLSTAQAALGAPNEAQLIEEAVRAHLQDLPSPEHQGEIRKLLAAATGSLPDVKALRTASRVLGTMLVLEPAFCIDEDSVDLPPLVQLFDRLEAEDQAILIRRCLGRLTDTQPQSKLARSWARTFLTRAQETKALLVGDQALSNSLRLALGTIGQSELDEPSIKDTAVQLLDEALFRGGQVPIRVLSRALPREAARLRARGVATVDRAVAEMDNGLGLIHALDTQLKVEVCLAFLANAFESPPQEVFAALLERRPSGEIPPPAIANIAGGLFELNTLQMLVDENGRAALHAIFRDHYGSAPEPSKLPSGHEAYIGSSPAASSDAPDPDAAVEHPDQRPKKRSILGFFGSKR
jgi:hypothetical protein